MSRSGRVSNGKADSISPLVSIPSRRGDFPFCSVNSVAIGEISANSSAGCSIVGSTGSERINSGAFSGIGIWGITGTSGGEIGKDCSVFTASVSTSTGGVGAYLVLTDLGMGEGWGSSINSPSESS